MEEPSKEGEEDPHVGWPGAREGAVSAACEIGRPRAAGSRCADTCASPDGARGLRRGTRGAATARAARAV